MEYFQSNYVMVFLVLVLYCLLTSPLLLIVIAASGGAAYIAGIKNNDRKLSIAGNLSLLLLATVKMILVLQVTRSAWLSSTLSSDSAPSLSSSWPGLEELCSGSWELLSSS